MLSSHTDPQFAFLLVQQRQQSLLAEAEHDRLVDEAMNVRAGSLGAGNRVHPPNWRAAAGLMLSALSTRFEHWLRTFQTVVS